MIKKITDILIIHKKGNLSYTHTITVDVLIERLIFIEKLEKRIERSKDEKATTFSHQEVKNIVSKW